MSIIKMYKNGYTTDSEIYSIVKPSIKIELNEYGEYSAVFENEKH